MREWERIAFGNRNLLFGTIFQPIVLAVVGVAFLVIGSVGIALVVFALAALSLLLWWRRRAQ